MNEKAGSRDLDDAEIVDAELEVIELSDCEKLVNRKAVKVVKTEKSTGPVARRLPADRIHTDSTRSCARNNGQDLLANISQVLDPNMRRARANDQSVNTLQTGQIFTLSSQLREAQRQTEALRNQIADAERRCQNAERRADRAELMEMISGSRDRQNFPRRPLSPVPPRVGRQPHRGSSRRRFRQEIYYGDGGRSTRYLGSDDDDDAEIEGHNDSPGTRRYTFEEKDQPDSSDRSTNPSGSFLPTPRPSSRDISPIMTIIPPTSISKIGSPVRYPSLEV
jgi:hypothetical protein